MVPPYVHFRNILTSERMSKSQESASDSSTHVRSARLGPRGPRRERGQRAPSPQVRTQPAPPVVHRIAGVILTTPPLVLRTLM